MNEANQIKSQDSGKKKPDPAPQHQLARALVIENDQRKIIAKNQRDDNLTAHFTKLLSITLKLHH